VGGVIMVAPRFLFRAWLINAIRRRFPHPAAIARRERRRVATDAVRARHEAERPTFREKAEQLLAEISRGRPQ